MTCQKNIPLDLMFLIFDYAYGWRFSCDPMDDVDAQKNIQESIPPCFLMARLPKPKWFHPEMGVHCLHKLDCILVPSPYRKGNPYYPTGALDPLFPRFSPAINSFVGLLSSYTCRRNHTYKACAIRRGEQLSNAELWEWNHYYKDFFSKGFLTDPRSFYQHAFPWSQAFIAEVCFQLEGAQFLPFYSADQL